VATLNGGIDASQELIRVSGTPPSSGTYFTLDSEAFVSLGTGPGPTNRDFHEDYVAVKRGVAGTTKATHSNGATLTPYYPDAPGGSGSGLPDWLAPDEINQTVDVFGGLHFNDQGTPPVGNGDVSMTLDGRTDVSTLISVTPTATNQVLLDLEAPDSQSASIAKVALNGHVRFEVQSSGTTRMVASDGSTNMLRVTSTEVEIGPTAAVYVDATVIALFGAAGTGQHVAIDDATDPASTQANVNTILQLLRDLGLIASA
jgi:hypothetical protein